MYIFRSFALALLLAFPAAEHGFAGDNNFQTEAEKAFGPVVRDYKIPGLVVGVTRAGQHSFYSVGLASRDDNRPITPDTLFELGSISKVFNVTLAALAERHGKLSLDDKASHYLCADTCRIGADMTLMDLATHHSGGLPLQVPDEIKSFDDLVTWLKAWQPPQPGTRSYSNISIGLLGHITASAMGMTYPQAAESVLFPELGLTNSWINVPAARMDDYAFGYDKSDRPVRVNPGVLDAEAYGIKTNARDMLTFLDAELGVREVSPDLKAAIERTHQGQFKTAEFTQAMIWEQYPWPADLRQMLAANSYDFIMHPQKEDVIAPPTPPQADVLLNKTGSTNGFGGYVAMIPGKKLGIIVLANRNYPNDARVKATYALIEAVLAEK